MIGRCHIGDCRTLLAEMAAADIRARTCVTSPPYFGLRDYGTDGQIGLEPTPEAYVAALVDVFRCVRDVLADDATVWLNLGDSYSGGGGFSPDAPSNVNGSKQTTQGSRTYKGRQPAMGLKQKDLIGIPWRVAFALQADGWYLRSDIVWHKPNPMPESVTDRPTKAHEYLFLLAKSERYYYDAAAIAEPADTYQRQGTNGLSPKMRMKQELGHVSAKTGLVDPYTYETRNRRSVWSVPTKPFAGAHFAVFPRALIEPCVLAGSEPDDIVLDPFMGSGTTAQAAEALGRRWIGCELQADYLPLIEARLQQRALAP